jgi:hypothetical protein
VFSLDPMMRSSSAQLFQTRSPVIQFGRLTGSPALGFRDVTANPRGEKNRRSILSLIADARDGAANQKTRQWIRQAHLAGL